MAERKTLGVYEFGRKLIETNDLDPVYVILWNSYSRETRDQMSYWLLAYWCFYHCGTASWIVDKGSKYLKSDDGSYEEVFWEAMEEAASDKVHPRGTERRHFRGPNGMKSVAHIADLCGRCKYKVPDLVNYLAGQIGPPIKAPTLGQVVSRVKELNGFGPWIAFKVADMLERLGYAQIIFEPSDIFNMFESPTKGAVEVALRHGPVPHAMTAEEYAYQRITSRLIDLKATPDGTRKLNIQEVETILCKWKSHLGGHYEVGKDIHEILAGLTKYGQCPTARLLIDGGIKAGLWTRDYKITS